MKRVQTTNVGQDEEESEPSFMVGGHVNWCSHCGKHKEISQKTTNRATIWPSNSTPGNIFKRNETLIQKDPQRPVFTVALFTIAKIWKQQKYPETAEWIKKKYYSAIKKNKNFAIHSNMDGLGGYYIKWNKSNRERKVLNDITYMWNFKTTTNQWV